MSVSSKWSKNGNYYINCMTLDDYYANTGGKEPPGEWFIAKNHLGERVALGIIDAKQFEAGDTEAFDNICQGYHPETGEKLVQNAGDPKRRALLDLTFSPDKTVSVVWAFASEEHKLGIQRDQRDAVRAALDFGSKMGAYTRQVVKERYLDAHGVEKTRRKVLKVKTNYIASLFEHGSSRADDPQLHTHATILNACVRPDGSTGTIESLHLMRWQGAMASIYHASLAHKLRERGCSIEMTGNTFKVAGVPADVCEAFSQRSKAIKAYTEEWQKANGMTADASRASKGLLQMATIETRDAKDELTREQLQEQWVARGKELGYTEQEALEVFQLGEPFTPLTREQLLAEAKAAVEGILETDATFKEPALVTKVAIHLTGRASVDDILQAVEDVKAELVASHELDEETGEVETVYSTREMLLIERDLQQLARSESPNHKLAEKAVDAAIAAQDAESRASATVDFVKRNGRQPTDEEVKGLEEEQAAAIRHVCLSDKTTSVVEGTAGAGKTFTMKIVGRLFTSAGYQVHGLSGAWTQALNLQKDAELASGRAIAGWLIDVQKGNIVLSTKDVVVMDEAGMVGVRDMRNVMAAVEKAGAKLILLGDTLQQNSVAAGDALRTVTEVTGSQRLDVIRRQKLAEDRAAVPLIFAGHAKEGLQTYIDKGQVHLCATDDDANAKLIGDWQRDRALHPKMSQVIIAVTNDDVRKLNRLAHESRKLHGELGESVQLRTMDSKDETDLVEFSVGDQVVFRNNQRDLGRSRRASEAAVARQAAREDRAVISQYGRDITTIGKLEQRSSTLQRELARDAQAVEAGRPGMSLEQRLAKQHELLLRREAVQHHMEAMEKHFSEHPNKNAKFVALRIRQALETGETNLRDVLRGHKNELAELAKADAAATGADREEDQAEAVYNRTTSVIQAIDAKTGVMTIKTDDGKLVSFDPKDTRWQHRDKDGKADGLALQHAYAVTATSSQGMTRDLAYGKDSIALNRRSGGVMASRHRESFNLYANKEALYEAKMRNTDATEWHHISKFSDEEALDRMARSWSRKSDKTSTLDYTAWEDAKGVRLHPNEELSLSRLAEAREHIEQLRAGQDAEPELPFQLQDAYAMLPLQQLEAYEAREARMHVMDDIGVTSRVLEEAQKQGFIELRRDDERGYTPSFVGRRPGDGAIVNRLRDGQADREEGALRDRYPPILKGDPKEVHIVATGEDALALWSTRERENKAKPTVIVAGDNVGEATQLKHVRDTLRQAEKAPVLWPNERMTPDQAKQASQDVAEVSGKKVDVKEEAAPAHQMREDLHQQRVAELQAAEERKNKPTLGG